MLKKLLKGQSKLIAANPLDVRLDANFLCDVSLAGSALEIKPELLAEIAALSDTLRFANAQAGIRTAYFDMGAPETVNGPFLSKMWVFILGKDNKEAVMQALSRGQTFGNHLLSYSEMEGALLVGLTHAKRLPTLSRQQKRAIEAAEAPPPLPPLLVEEPKPAEASPVDDSAAAVDATIADAASPAGSPAETRESSPRNASPQNATPRSATLKATTPRSADEATPHRSASQLPSPLGRPSSRPPSPTVRSHSLSSSPRNSPPSRAQSPPVPMDKAEEAAHMSIIQRRIVEGGLSPVLQASSPLSNLDSPRSPGAASASQPKADSADSMERFMRPTQSFAQSTWAGAPITGIVSSRALNKAVNASPPMSRPDGRTISPHSPSLKPVRSASPTSERPGSSDVKSPIRDRLGLGLGLGLPIRDRSPAPSLRKDANSANSATGSCNVIPLRKGLSPQQNRPSTESKGEPPEDRRNPNPNRNRPKRLFKARPKAGQKTDSLLNLSGLQLSTLDVPRIPLMPPTSLQSILVLNLSRNNLFDFASLQLSALKAMTDLDCSHNSFSGPLPQKFIPSTMQRLNMSNNRLTDVSSLLGCLSLRDLNISSNVIRKFNGLPSSLELLDFSGNLINSLFSLRLLSLSPRITHLSLAGNPVLTMAVSSGQSAAGAEEGEEAQKVKKEMDWRTVVKSVLPLLVSLDGVAQPSKHNAKKRAVAGLGDKAAQGVAKPYSASPQAARIAPGAPLAPGLIPTASRPPSPVPRRKQQELDDQRAQTFRALRERLESTRQEYDAALEAELRARTKTISKTDMQKLLSRLAVSKNTPTNKAAAQLSLVERQARDGAVFRIREWMKDSSMEMGQASSVLKGLFDVLHRGTSTIDGVSNILRQLQRVPFIKGVKLHPSINNAVGMLAQEETVLDDLAEHLEHMVGFSTVLQEVERVLLDKATFLEELGSDDGIKSATVTMVDVRGQIDDLFMGEVGSVANERVLRMFGNEYIVGADMMQASSSSKSSSSKSSSSRAQLKYEDDEPEVEGGDEEKDDDDLDLQKIAAQDDDITDRSERDRVFSRLAEGGRGGDRILETAARMEEVKLRLSMRAMRATGATIAMPFPPRPAEVYQESDDGNVSISTDVLGSEDEGTTSNVVLAGIPSSGSSSSAYSGYAHSDEYAASRVGGLLATPTTTPVKAPVVAFADQVTTAGEYKGSEDKLPEQTEQTQASPAPSLPHDQRESPALSTSDRAWAAQAVAAQQAAAVVAALNRRDEEAASAAAPSSPAPAPATGPATDAAPAPAPALAPLSAAPEDDANMTAKDRIKARLAALKNKTKE